MNLAKSPKSISKTPRKSAINSQLQAILDNRTEGAAIIEKRTIELIANILDSKALRDSSKARLVGQSIGKIKRRFGSMANIINLSDLIERNLKGVEKLPAILANYKTELGIDRQTTIGKAAQVILKYRAIFTISNSSMVRESLLSARKAGWHGIVYIVESRPKNEGIILAEMLSRSGIETVVGVDLMMRKFIAESDAVFLGSDCVTESYFVNKIGSGMAVDIAKSEKKKVYVLTDKSKVISARKYSFSPDNNPADEVYKSENKKIDVINQYFEAVRPSGRFHYICGGKVLLASRMAKIISE